MLTVVAFISQKGGVGKSTLARSVGICAAQAGHKVSIGDLDRLQQTLVRWTQTRDSYGLAPTVSVEAYVNAEQACAASAGNDLLLLDTPGKVNDLMTDVARRASLLVLPTSPSLDDLYPSVLVHEALQNVGIARERLVFALCRVLCEHEAERARSFLVAQGYSVLSGQLYEHLGYRDALNTGRALTETQDENLNALAELVVNDVLERVRVQRDEMRSIHVYDFRNVRSERPASRACPHQDD
jgi:chromosome partitioning protein